MGARYVRVLEDALGVVLVTAAGVSGAAAAVPLSACGTLGTANETDNVTAGLHADGGDCLVVANNRITINLQGHSIIQDTPTAFGAGITDGASLATRSW